MKKKLREQVYNKHGGKCAYCGKSLLQSQMQVDHIKPLFRSWSDNELVYRGLERGKNDADNLNPSCVRCNRWKATYTLEEFRIEIKAQLARVTRDSAGFRLALDYNQIKATDKPVLFYFERANNEK